MTNQQQQLSQSQSTEAAPVDINNLLFNHNAMEQLHHLAVVMAGGKATVPQHLQGNPADCMAIIMQAAQWRMNPFAVAQKTHTIKGVLGYEAQLVNAVITSMAPTEGRLQFEWYGPWDNVIGKFVTKQGNNGPYHAPGWTPDDERGCGIKVFATLKGERMPRVLDLLLSQAQVRNSTLWASDPKQQLAYLAIKRWSRLYVPDVIMGVYTPDEMDGYGAGEQDITPKQEATAQVNNQAPVATEVQQPKTASSVKSKLSGMRQQQQEETVVEYEQQPELKETQLAPSFANFSSAFNSAGDQVTVNEIWSGVMGSDLPDNQKEELYKIYQQRFSDVAPK